MTSYILLVSYNASKFNHVLFINMESILLVRYVLAKQASVTTYVTV